MKQFSGRARQIVRLLGLLFVLSAALGSAATLTPGDILVGRVYGPANILSEYTPSGQLVQDFNIPNAPGDSTGTAGIAADGNGNVQIYNGFSRPSLTTLDPSTGVIQNHTFPGWSSGLNSTFGGIATLGNYAYVTDMSPQPGLLRFNLTDFSAVRFTMRDGYQSLTIGRDGLLYALPGEGLPADHIDVFDPATLSFVRSVSLAAVLKTDVRSLAVDVQGHLYTVGAFDTSVFELDGNGQLIKSLALPCNVFCGLYNIALDAGNDLVVSGNYNNVYVTSTNLESVQSFFFPYASPGGRVAFTNPEGSLGEAPEPGAAGFAALGLLSLLAASRFCRKG